MLNLMNPYLIYKIKCCRNCAIQGCVWPKVCWTSHWQGTWYMTFSNITKYIEVNVIRTEIIKMWNNSNITCMWYQLPAFNSFSQLCDLARDKFREKGW